MFARRSLLAAAALVATVVPLALAQPAPRPRLSLLIRAQSCLGDEGLQKELKLTDDQARKATELARNGVPLQRSYLQADDKEREKINADVKKNLEGFLKPEQMTRLREVILQNLASIGGTVALLGDAEVVKRLKLTEEQTKKFQAREKLADVLNEEQKKEWAKLTGKPYTELLRITNPGGGGGKQRRIFLPVALQLLATKSVRDELKLTDKQQEQVKTLKSKYERELDRADDNTKRADDAHAAGDKEARALLEPAQVKRLGQIEVQVMTRGGKDDAVLRYGRVVEALKLSRDQQKRIAATTEKRRADMLALFAADEDAKKIAEKVQAYKKETEKRLLAVLDESQRTALKDLVGEPFTAEDLSIRRRPTPDTSPLYVYLTGARYLGSADLHKELKVGDAAAQKLTDLASKAMTAEMVGGKGSPKEKAEANKKEASGLLDARQMKRFEEIYLTFASKPVAKGAGWPTDPNVVFRYAEVREPLDLTDEQQRSLARGDAEDKVLDEAQARKWKELRGEPFKGTLQTPGAGRRLAAPPYLYDVAASYLGSPDLHKELKVNADTARKLTAFAEKAYAERSASGKGGKGVEPKTPSRSAKERAEANKKELSALLDARQRKRFEEVYLAFETTRREGFSVLARPFRYAEVQEALKLTDEQKSQAQATGSAANAVKLDEAQAKKWKEMRGEPFTGTLSLPRQTVRLQPTLYLFDVGASYAGSPDLHKELKVNEETARKLTAFAEKAYVKSQLAAMPVTSDKGGKARAEANKKELSAILDARQMKRFEEVYLRESLAKGTKGGLNVNAAFRHAEVQEALKLTDEQKSQAQATRFGKRNDLKLDETQEKKWKEMRGEPFTGTLRLPGGEFGTLRLTRSVLLAALQTTSVQDELKLTQEQKDKLGETELAYFLKRGLRLAPNEEARQRSQAAHTELEQAVKKILEGKQHTRLQQIVWQDVNRNGLRALLADAAMRASLKMDEAQFEKIAALNKDADEVRSLLGREYRSEERSSHYDKASDAMTKNAQKRLETALTAKQREQMKTLLGEPFEGQIDRDRSGGFDG